MIPITLVETLLLIFSAGLIGGLSYRAGTKDGFDKGWNRCMRIVYKEEHPHR